jgi:hypothetical protein
MSDPKDMGFQEDLSSLAELHLSAAARAYGVALSTLDAFVLLVPAGGTIRLQEGRDAVRAARNALTMTLTDMGLAWNAVPVSRFLRSHAGILSDSLYYASAAAIRGYGALGPPVSDFLTDWHRIALEAFEDLNQAIYGRPGSDARTPSPLLVQPGSLHGELGQHQQLALSGALCSLAQTLLLIKAYANAGLPPLSPAFAPSYAEEQLRYILVAEGNVEGHLEALGAAFATALPWRSFARDNIIRATRDASESLSLVSTAAWQHGDSHLVRLAELAVAAGRVQTLALNLRE